MRADIENKYLELSREDLFQGFPCPVCGVHYVPNGTGPTNLPLVARLLKWIPSESMVGGDSARFHDCAYLLCPAGWMIEFNSGLHTYHAWNKKSADESYLNLMKERYLDSRGLSRFLAWTAAKRNNFFVRAFGKKSYIHEHKKGNPVEDQIPTARQNYQS